jgi:hypothetical protein
VWGKGGGEEIENTLSKGTHADKQSQGLLSFGRQLLPHAIL